MMKSRYLRCCLVCALFLGMAAHADVYKWTDERGVVHYSNTPPPKATPVVRLPGGEERLTIVPGSEPAQVQDGDRDEPLRQRIDTLERQLEQERRERALLAQSEEERRRRAIEECERQRRVDCDQLDTTGTAPGVIVAPPPRRRAQVVPTLPVPSKPKPAPEGLPWPKEPSTSKGFK
jgi:hypothetical protein